MPIATTTALLIGAGIAAGGSAASAGIASHAAGKAAETQAESADKALALQQQMYAQNRQDTAPWREAGGQAISTLGGLMGLPSGPAASQQGPNQQFYGSAVKGIMPLVSRLQRGEIGGPMAQARPLADVGGGQVATARAGAPNAGGSFQAPGVAQTQSSYVQMQAPTGETQSVPADQVGHFEQLGARRVG